MAVNWTNLKADLIGYIEGRTAKDEDDFVSSMVDRIDSQVRLHAQDVSYGNKLRFTNTAAFKAA